MGRVDGVVRILGVFAQPDNEVFCAGGTFARYAAAGADITVLTATRGEAGQTRDAQIATRRTLPGVRERELRDACYLVLMSNRPQALEDDLLDGSAGARLHDE